MFEPLSGYSCTVYVHVLIVFALGIFNHNSIREWLLGAHCHLKTSVCTQH